MPYKLCLFLISVFLYFGFEFRALILFLPVYVYCLSFTFLSNSSIFRAISNRNPRHLISKLAAAIPRTHTNQQINIQYANTPMQYIAIFHGRKNVHFQMIFKKKKFLFLLKTLIVGTRSNENPQSMLWSKNKKKAYPCKPQFNYIKVGCKGVFVTRACFHDVKKWIVSLFLLKLLLRKMLAYQMCKL